MIVHFDFIVTGYIKSDGWSQQVKIPVTVNKPSCDPAIEEARRLLVRYEFDFRNVEPIKKGLERSLEYKAEQLKLEC